MVENKYSNAGITLITLVITVIVLLILASITIATLNGENGILTRASEAKIKTAIGNIKENLSLEQNERVIDNKEDLSPEVLLSEKKVKRILQLKEDGNYYMYYIIKNEAYDGMQGLGNGTASMLKDVFLIDDELNVKYIDKTGKEYGEDIEEKILEDETKIRFASKEFSEYVSKISGATEEETKFGWMKNQTSLTIEDAEIDSLEDLVFFPNLEALVINDLKIKNLDGIENCIKLESLNLISTNIENFKQLSNLSEVTNIQLLYGNNNVKDFVSNIKNLPKLQALSLNYTGGDYDHKIIRDLPLSLTRLTIRGATDRITNLDGIQNLINLTYLQLDVNKISTIKEIGKLTKLTSLNLANNDITDITPLSANTLLTTLNLKGNTGIDGNRANYTGERLEALNKIGEILDRGGQINIDVDKLGLFDNYKELNLNSQNLITLEPLEGLTQLTSLSLESNKLTLEDKESQEILQSMTNLKSLKLSYNNITNITAINSLKNLTTLYLVGDTNKVDLKEIEDIISNLTNLRVSNDSLKTIINCDINKITRLNLYSSSLTEIPDLSIFTELEILNLMGNPNISNFDIISEFISLKDLNLSSNNLHGKMIDFSKLTNLTNLNLSSNTLWSEDLENLKDLKNNENLTINLSNNSIIDATALLELDPNTKINLSNNVNLSRDSKDKLKARFGNNVTF